MSTTPLPPSASFVANAFLEPSGPREEVIVNPATEEVLGRVTSAADRDVDAAIGAARRAADTGAWSSSTPRERSAALEALVDETYEMTRLPLPLSKTGISATYAGVDWSGGGGKKTAKSGALVDLCHREILCLIQKKALA